MEIDATARKRIGTALPMPSESQRRRYLAAEAESLGRGGLTAVAVLAGVSRAGPPTRSTVSGGTRGARRGTGRPQRPRRGERQPADRAKLVRGLRFPLPENPEDLTEGQESALAAPRRAGTALWRGYPPEEGLRTVFRADAADAAGELDRWLAWACRCRIPAFAGLSRKAGRKREGILRSTGLGVPDARVEAASNKIKVAIRQGYGSHDIDNLIALVMLRCSDLRPTLPGRAVVT